MKGFSVILVVFLLSNISSNASTEPLALFIKALQGTISEQMKDNTRCKAFDFYLIYAKNLRMDFSGLFETDIFDHQVKSVQRIVEEDVGKDLHFGFRTELRLNQPCHLILMPISKTAAFNSTRWYNFFQRYHMTGYFIFIVNNSPTQESMEEEDIIAFTKSTTVFHTAFIFDHKTHAGFNRDVVRYEYLIPIWRYDRENAGEERLSPQKVFFEDKPLDFQLSPLTAMVCAICDRELEQFKESGHWNDLITANFYELALYLNATLELENIFALPRAHKDENGEWDDFLKALESGTSHISSMITPTPENMPFYYLIKPTYFEQVMFVTANPVKITYSSLLRLGKPLMAPVWFTMFGAIIIIFLGMELAIHAKQQEFLERAVFQLFRKHITFASPSEISLVRNTMPVHYHRLTMFAILKCVVDQNGLDSLNFCKHIKDSLIARFMIGIWFFMSIVLICAYKSKMIEMIVLPEYSHPPSTFKELADSSYGINTIFWSGVIDRYLTTINTTWGNKILDRGREVDYFHPECYQSIFEGNNVCLGFKGLFDNLGIEFMMDTKKRKMYVPSKESKFPSAVNMGTSRHFPMIWARFGFILTSFQQAGMLGIWAVNGEAAGADRGHRNAFKFVETKHYYNGKSGSSDGGNYNIPKLLLQLMIAGEGMASVCLLAELFREWWRKDN